MGAIRAKLMLFGLGMGLLGSLMVVDAVWAQRGVSFIAQQAFRVGVGPSSVTVGDFNGDGRPDLATANSGSSTVSILLGQGDGTFIAAPEVAVGLGPVAVAVGDFNGDTHPDLAVANAVANNVSILLGRGNGLFQSAPEVAVGLGPVAVAVGEFNGDGHQDLAVVNSHFDSGAIPGSVSILLGQGNGIFQTAPEVGVGVLPFSVAVGEFNGDGHQDLAVANSGVGSDPQTVSIVLGTGMGTFSTAPEVGVGGEPRSIAVGDFNGDGRQDLAVANIAVDVFIVSIFLGRGDGTFVVASEVEVGNSPDFVAVGDVNGDGYQDLATANLGADTVSIVLGRGDGTFKIAQDLGVGGGPTEVAVGDFNGDGRQDLATANGSVSILLNNTPGMVVNDVVTFEPLPLHLHLYAGSRRVPQRLCRGVQL
jgi:FG-GAP-like repeat/FG-GAP repeat